MALSAVTSDGVAAPLGRILGLAKAPTPCQVFLVMYLSTSVLADRRHFRNYGVLQHKGHLSQQPVLKSAPKQPFAQHDPAALLSYCNKAVSVTYLQAALCPALRSSAPWAESFLMPQRLLPGLSSSP